jgi:DNA-directed RNA polymerase
MNNRERQLELEMKADAAAQADRLKQLQEQALSGDATMPRASRFIAQAYNTVRESFVAAGAQRTRGRAAKYANWVRALDPGVAAVIALREVINTCAGERQEPITVQVLASKIGRLYELEVRVKEAETVNPVYMGKVHDQIKERGTTNQKHIAGVYRHAYQEVMKGFGEEPLSTSEHIQLGKVGLQAVIDAGVINMVKTANERGKLFYYELHPDVEQYLTRYSERDVQDLRDPHAMLMLCPPDPWDGLVGGGYLSNRRKVSCQLMSLTRVRRSEHKRLREVFVPENMPKVFQCANYLQATPFSLHKPTLDAILNVWQTGGTVMGMPQREKPEKPEFPLPADWVRASATQAEQDLFGRWKRDMVRYYEGMKTWRGKVRELSSFLKTGRNAGELVWCPVFTDTRNRWYYRSSLNPQGSDMAKATLHFGQKRALGERGLFWLRVSVATHFGYDKARFKQRAQWTVDNWSKIEQALDAPADNAEVWGKDAPWCMFSTAWELREALRSGDPASYCTGVPVHIDATCSGLQHFCAMLRDAVGGKFVNLFESDPTFMGPKLDIYGQVTKNALDDIREQYQYLSDEERLYADFWLRLGCPRDMSKKPVMTYVYGATLSGTCSHVESTAEDLWGRDCWGELSSYRCSLFMAKALMLGVERTVPAAAECMRWLQSLTRQHKGKRMEWTSLTGFKVTHDYQDYDEERVKVNSCGIVQTVVRVFNGKVKPLQMANAISPNFVHNLDATHLTLTALKLQALGMQMVAIHDSFGTHPSDVDALATALREAFYEMYSNTDLLANIAFEHGIVCEPPARGDLDLSLVLNSEFFFC